jgi:carbamoyl-phosphate synthase small subunit
VIAKLALEDGSVFTGRAFGAPGTRTGEVVFNTAMSGYQEVFTDPSYCGQIVTMTFPLMGNYGVNPEDFESRGLHLSGVVVKELPSRPANFRSQQPMAEFLAQHGIPGLAGVDTRALTRRLRIQGALRGVLSTDIGDDLELVRLARGAESMSGANLVQRVTPRENSSWSEPLWHSQPAPPSRARPPRVVAVDCGIKFNILRHLAERGCEVLTVPAAASAAAIRELSPDGLLVGNGPGDPAAVETTIRTLRELIGQLPIFGICLGHQLLALALGAQTYKLRFGHHGTNLPVRNQLTGRVEITSQNHGFCVEPHSLERAGGSVSHVNLNDGSLEGFVHPDRRIMAVQFHPEASPGPHDASYLFTEFTRQVAPAVPAAPHAEENA